LVFALNQSGENMENQKPKSQTPEVPSSGSVDVGKDVSGSVIVTGRENVINLGSKNSHSNSRKRRSQPRKSKRDRKRNIQIVVAVIGAVGLIIAAIISSPNLKDLWAKITAPTAVLTMESPTLPNAEIPETPVTDLPASTKEIASSDGMKILNVPAGEFTMGSDKSPDGDESPVHIVYLDSFGIDQTEVTNAMYILCVNAGECSSPKNIEFFANSSYAEHPVVYVTWDDAYKYCTWAGQRLPTEAEWEKAARGTDERTYPWGEEIDCNKANYGTCYLGTKKAGLLNIPSFYGALDMAGNVWEWVSDWYGKSYYQTSDPNNPKGPPIGEYRVIRGGSHDSEKAKVTTTVRQGKIQNDQDNRTGFRCASTLGLK